MIIYKDYQGSHFDYIGHSSVEDKISVCQDLFYSKGKLALYLHENLIA